MPTYAAETTVSSERSQQEIQQTLRRYGAKEFQLGWSDEMAMIAFVAKECLVRFILPMPDRQAKEFTWTNHTSPRRRTPKQQEEAYEQATRQRWRALNLVIKAKLEAVDANIVSFEQEFAMFMVMPDGKTAGEHVLPKIAEAIASAAMPPSLFPSFKAIES